MMKKWLLLSACCLFTVLVYGNPLPAHEVFQVQAAVVDPNTFSVHFKIKPHYFLYQDRIKLIPQEEHILQLGTVRFPAPQLNQDKQGNNYPIYKNSVSIPVGVLGEKPGTTTLSLHYQGCSDDGFCYAPEEKIIQLDINPQLALSKAFIEQPPTTSKKRQEADSDKISALFLEHNWFIILLTFYGLGLLLSFTPCILPMVPVLSGIIVGHGRAMTTRKAFLLSLSYVLSMSITYAIFGAIVALLGANLQINLQSPWSIILFSFIFILLALSMFGFYEFKLPEAWQAKIGNSSRTQRGGHYLGAAVMGCLSTLILSPCVTAPLIGVLTYIAQTGNVILGCITLFVLSLGMGTPLLLIGTSAGRWLPQAGNWMNAIKALFGIMFLIVAIFLLSRIIPELYSMWLWACLFIFTGIYCGALTYASQSWDKLKQGLGLILLGYGFMILVGASMGTTDPLYPLKTATSQGSATLNKFRSQNLTQIQQEIARARGNPVMLDFYADWCRSCKIMENTIFNTPQVKQALSHFTVIKIDVTANSAEDKAILQYFNVVAPPTFVFFNDQGKPLADLKLVGELSTEKLLLTLEQILQKKN